MYAVVCRVLGNKEYGSMYENLPKTMTKGSAMNLYPAIIFVWRLGESGPRDATLALQPKFKVPDPDTDEGLPTYGLLGSGSFYPFLFLFVWTASKRQEQKPSCF